MSILRRYRHVILGISDIVVVFISYLIVCLLVSKAYEVSFGQLFSVKAAICAVSVHMIVFVLLQMYRIIWRYAKVGQFVHCIAAEAIATTALFVMLHVIQIAYPFQVYLLLFNLCVLLLLLSRFVYIILWSLANRLRRRSRIKATESKRLLIVGAGCAASMVISDIHSGRITGYQPVCIVDDDLAKRGRMLGTTAVVGGTEDIPKLCEKERIQAIMFCIVAIDEAEKRRILNLCTQTDCDVMKMTIAVQNNDEIANIQSVSIDDLLGREPIILDNEQVVDFISGSVVMVTGGGGSIGSELCRQIAKLKPKQLIILDIYENNAYGIEQELRFQYGDQLNLVTEIASVRDAEKLKVLFETYHPQLVFHTAAHKHVPFMEHNPEEAVKNNVVGTRHVAKLAHRYGVKRFVMVSTDKAVNPTNIMGATKRCCEMIVQCMDKISKTEFVAVRFGNVLGSNGSVIPLFKDQIAKGGPVTVTHPEVIRYFMTIPEAVELILAAGSMAKGGEIFILDMGEPVKILDLAKKMIRLSGFQPGRDIKIEFTGLRPGEKLFEELLLSEEGIQKTENEKIFVGSPLDIDAELFFTRIAQLEQAAMDNNSEAVCQLIPQLVPTYHKPQNT